MKALLAACLFISMALLGCAQNTVQPEEQTYAPLPPPSLIVVHQFAVDQAEVREDQGIYQHVVDATESTTMDQRTTELAHQTAAAFANELVKKIMGLGLPAQAGGRAADVPPGALVITGYFIDIDEGNRTERLVIGLGAGKAKLDTNVRLLAPTDTGYRTVLEFKTHADSGDMPGAAETMGAGAAAQGTITAGMAAANVAVTGFKAYESAMGGMATRSADRAAQYLSQYFAQQGWIPISKVIEPTL